jgi:hypothetical protein
MGERGGKIMTVSSQREGDRAVLQIATELSPSTPGLHAEDPESSLGVAACQGIVQEHRAQVSCQWGDDGKLLLRVELPAAETVPESEKETTALWQSQPFA